MAKRKKKKSKNPNITYTCRDTFAEGKGMAPDQDYIPSAFKFEPEKEMKRV